MTVEGELDDITGVGQCSAALDLCSSIPKRKKVQFVQPGVGHYGVFNGSRFSKFIFPEIHKFIQANEPSKLSAKRRIGLNATS